MTDANVPPPMPTPQYAPTPASGPIGRPRNIGISILLAIVTLGIYTFVWTYKTYDEMKRHTGQGVGGGIGLLLQFFISPVTFFLVPSEIKSMYERDGRTTDLTPLWGLWFLLPLIGPFVWFFKVQGTLNDYWVSKGATRGVTVPPLLRQAASDEYEPLPWSARDARALERLSVELPRNARAVGMSADEYRFDRRATAATLRAIDAEHGGGFFAVPGAAVLDATAAESAFSGSGAVIDVQTHLVDPARWSGSHAAALAGFLEMVDPERWPDGVDPNVIDAGAWAALVFGASETAIALLTSTPGPADSNVLTNRQIASAREVVDRYADPGRVLTHAIVHPNLGVAELDAMAEWSETLRPSGWKCYTLWGPPTKASPTGGWFLDDEEIGFPFLERVRALGPRVVATHKGLGGPIPDASVAAASPRDIGAAAAAFPDIDFVVYHSGYERNPDGQEGAYAPRSGGALQGVDRLVATLADHAIGPGANVYAELGTTWFLMLRRPLEAAHVLGKLLTALGPERILWGTDSIWYGSPQPLIDAFRAFQIPEALQERYGYPPLDDDAKQHILSDNARRVYGIADATVDRVVAERDASWVANAAPALQRALASG